MHNDVQLLPSKEASVARAVISDPKRRADFEPLYDIDPQTSASVEVFYADRALANSFGSSTGWFWWTCQRGFLPEELPAGPFATSYAAYRNFVLVASNLSRASTTAAAPITPRVGGHIGRFHDARVTPLHVKCVFYDY
jgi:hypothetical protein